MHPPCSRHYLESLARNGQLTADGLDTALHRLGLLPDASAWQLFGSRFLLAAGTLLLLAGLVFFFAFNWNDLHRFVKMALVVLPLVLATGMAARFGLERSGGQASLGAATVLTGVLLAVIGQIYQTGADSELLFAGWAVLALPWVAIACAPWLWLFWLLLVNTALAIFLLGRLDLWAVFFFSDAMFWGPLLLNAAALLFWESCQTRVGWMRVAYAPRFIALLAAAAATGLGVSWWFLSKHVEWRLMHYAPLIYLLWFGVTLWFYKARRQDIVPLAAAALSAIAVLTAGLIKWLFEDRSYEVAAFFFTGTAVAAMTAGAAVWLRQTMNGWEKMRAVRNV